MFAKLARAIGKEPRIGFEEEGGLVYAIILDIKIFSDLLEDKGTGEDPRVSVLKVDNHISCG
jgi:hypothetical protein